MTSRIKRPRFEHSNAAGTLQQSARRVNSVYDLTSLRLHPDGLRAQDPSSRLWTGNRFHRPAALQDRHGNILAPDAVGMPYVKRKRSASPRRREQASDDDEENFEDDFDYSDGDQPQHKGRARLRHSFHADYSFLDEPENEEEKQREEMRRLYHPSSDLLKYIHHHASQVYAGDGELFDVHISTSGRPARSGPTSRASSPDAPASGTPPSDSGSSTTSSSEQEDDNAREKNAQAPPAADPEGLRKLQKGKRKTGLPVGRPITTGTYQARKELAEKRANDRARLRQPKAKRNMYRAFDGSALFCIGLLLQEHIAKMIDQPLRLSLDPQVQGLRPEELLKHYEQTARELQEEEEDAVEREVRRRLHEGHEQS